MKMYILVRQDLSVPQQAVQGGHALAEYLLKFPDTQWRNGVLIYLRVPDEFELERWAFKLEEAGIHHIEFREPDIGDELTAIAAPTNTRIFSRLKLL